MDVTAAVMTSLFHRLRDDPQLATIMSKNTTWGGPYSKAPPDPPTPYIVHRLGTLEGQDNATRPASYTVEVWDAGENMDRIWAVRARLMALLDLARINVPNQGTLRLWLASETALPDFDRNWLNTTLTFMVRYARAGEVRAITEGTT